MGKQLSPPSALYLIDFFKILIPTKATSIRPSRNASVEHYKAAMLLSGAGDALGYKNQLWEYNESGPAIHQVRAATQLIIQRRNQTLNAV